MLQRRNKKRPAVIIMIMNHALYEHPDDIFHAVHATRRTPLSPVINFTNALNVNVSHVRATTNASFKPFKQFTRVFYPML